MSEMIEEYLRLEGPAIDLVVQRDVEAQDRDGLGRGLSQQAMAVLDTQMITWVGTRMMRFEKERGVMPQRVVVTVSVEMEI